jgi:hypothetical protein
MTNYLDDISQAERRAVLKSDRDARNTYFERAQADAEDGVAGRWARPAPTVVTGGSQYPAASASHSDPSPPEEPLGYSVDEHEAVGSPAEIERSQREAAGAASSPAAPEGSAPVVVLGPGAGLSVAEGPQETERRA